MLSFVTLSCLVAGIFAATTTAPPHEHHESNEMENFSFGYDHSSQTVVVRSTATCFIWELTSDEISSIHTNAGMTAVETRVIKEIDTASYTVVPPAVLNIGILRVCKVGVHHGTNLRYAIVH